MLKGIDINETRDYISKYDQDKDNPTVFKLGVLDPIVRAKLEDEATTFEVSSANPRDKAKTTLSIASKAIDFVRFGLKGIENFQDKYENKVEFDAVSYSFGGRNYQVVSDRILSMLPFNVIKELAEEIAKDNILSKAEEKN